MSQNKMPEFSKDLLHARWFTDPVCSWSFAAEEAIGIFRQHFTGRLIFENRMLTLYRNLDRFLEHHGMALPAEFAPKIEKVSLATGKPISSEAWKKGAVPHSSEDACLWVKAAQSIDPSKGDLFLSLLRKTLFVDARNIGEVSVLEEMAHIVGLDPLRLKAMVNTEENKALLSDDGGLARLEGVETRPTLVLRNSGGDRVFIGGLMDAELYIHAGEVLLREA
ncbi:MAG: DsbA family protein [Leptospirillum sp.]